MPAPDARGRGTVLPAVAATALVLLAVVAAGFRGTWSADPAPVGTPGPGPAPPPVPVETASVDLGDPPPVQEATPLEAPAWLEGAVTALAVALLVGLVVLGVRWLLTQRRARRTGTLALGDPGAVSAATDTVPAELPDLEPALERAARALRQPGAPADAIVAAWVALEETAASSGTARAPAQTPTEFTTALLARTSADPAALATLRRTYLAARFGTTLPTGPDVVAAADAIARIRETWRDADADAARDAGASR